MPIKDDLIILVPIGEENAVSSRLLWQQLGTWAATSVKGQLRKLAAQGLIQSKIGYRGGMKIKLYFRKHSFHCVNSTISNSRTKYD